MPIPLTCACGKALKAPDSLAGKRVKCPGCGGILTVPAAGKTAAPPSRPAPPPPPRPAASKPPGKTAIAAPPKPPPPPAARPSAAKTAVGDLHSYAFCPVCNAFVSKKDAICVQCGLNLVTGRKLATKQSSEPTGPPHATAVLCLVLNIPFAGLGTLIGGGRGERTKGMIQMGTYLAGLAAANPWVPDLPHILDKDAGGLGLVATLGGILLVVVGVSWSALTGLAILNSAQTE